MNRLAAGQRVYYIIHHNITLGHVTSLDFPTAHPVQSIHLRPLHVHEHNVLNLLHIWQRSRFSAAGCTDQSGNRNSTVWAWLAAEQLRQRSYPVKTTPSITIYGTVADPQYPVPCVSYCPGSDCRWASDSSSCRRMSESRSSGPRGQLDRDRQRLLPRC